MTVQRLLISTTAASALLFSLAAGAHAEVSAEAVIDGLKRQLSLQGMEFTAESSEMRGNDVMLSGVTVTPTAAENENKFTIDQILLEDVEEAGNGAFVVGRAAVPAFSNESNGYTVAFEGAAVEGYYIAGPDETDPIAKGGVYRTIEIGGVTVGKGGSPAFQLEGVSVAMSPYEVGGTMDYDVKVKDFTIDFTQVDDPKAKATMGELGYETLTGRVNATGQWNAGNGDASMSQSIVLDDAMALNIDIAVGGYTPELIAAIQEMNKQMQEQSDQAQGLAMMGLMQQLQIGTVSIELVDDSATGKILDFVGKQQGTTREGVVAMAKGTLPFALAQLQNPDFSASVTAAVGAFLDSPGSLKIAAMPAAPVPVAQIMGAAMAAPQSIIGVLNLKVTANE